MSDKPKKTTRYHATEEDGQLAIKICLAIHQSVGDEKGAVFAVVDPEIVQDIRDMFASMEIEVIEK